MALIGRLHPVLVHFPIALIVAAFGCELVSLTTRAREWHVAAVANLRIGAVFAVGSTIAGWIFAASPLVDMSPSLEWHRWVGASATLAASPRKQTTSMTPFAGSSTVNTAASNASL